MLLGISTGDLHRVTQPISSKAINIVKNLGCNAIELGCQLVSRIPFLKNIKPTDLKEFSYISLHSPAMAYSDNLKTKKILNAIETAHKKFNFDCVVFHCHKIKDLNIFKHYTFPVAIENNDRWHQSGQTPESLNPFLANNDSKIVLDLNHCSTIDHTSKLAKRFHRKFKQRIGHIHLSGFIDKTKKHEPLFITKQTQILKSIPNKKIPIIIESEFNNQTEAKQELNYIKNYLTNYVK